MTDSPDILIVGGGPVGTTLALALKNNGLEIEVLEARAKGPAKDDPRMLALSEGSRLLLQRLGVWNALSSFATPIETIHVSQRGRLGRTVIHAQDEGQQALGHVLPYSALASALNHQLEESGHARITYGARATTLQPNMESMTVCFDTLENSTQSRTTRLAVLADGAKGLDELPGILRKTHDYGQHAIVAKVICDLPHGNTAYERFTPDGPVALLPDSEYGFALVWTATPVVAETLCQIDETMFLERLQQHFGGRAGKFQSVANRAAFPLKLITARPVTSPHLAVIGNAAQTLHPVAGQGFNLGLRDAWELALTLRDTPPDEIGGPEMLERYQTRRNPDTDGGIFFTDFLVRVFSNDLPGIGHLRGAGLALADLISPAKHFVSRKMSFGANG